MKLLITLLGLILVLEGLPYAAFPEAMQNFLKQLTTMPTWILRILGSIAVAFGIILCYITQQTSLFSQ